MVYDQVTYKRLKEAVQSLGNISQQGPAAGLVDVLFGVRPPRFVPNLPAWQPVNTGETSLVLSVLWTFSMYLYPTCRKGLGRWLPTYLT